MSDPDRVQSLAELIKGYQDSYYNGEAEIADADFDKLWDELKALAPDHPLLRKVGADSLDGFPKVRHLIPMGSQEKAANPEAFLAWAARQSTARFVAQHKMDGASLELQYEQGRLVRAVTRGDGLIGDEITRNARRMQGCLERLDLPFSGGVRCEVVMSHEVWERKYLDKANCRNAANGLMRRKDGEGSEDLNLICYDAASDDAAFAFSDEEAKLAWLAERGYHCVVSRSFAKPEEIVAWRDEVSAARSALPFDIDGIVVKCLETDREDLRRTRPERQIAFKFELEQAVSVLREVVWSESGATYTPIGIIDPVRLAGTSVQRANLNNPGLLRSMGLQIGSRVVVVKRGEIIPKIEGLAPGETEEAQGTPIAHPTVCGTCGATLVDAQTRLYCPNPACPKRLHHRIEKWIDVLGIREFGEQLLRRLYDSGRLERVADLYTLSEQELAALDRMGELSAARVYRHLREPRVVSLAAFVAGFDFEGVGETILDKVVQAGFNTLELLRSASLEALANVFGLGEITARTIVDGLIETREDMDAVLAAGVVSIALPLDASQAPLRGYSFCFTGELTALKRSEAQERVKVLGGLVKTSVSADLSYLVTNDAGSGSSKNRKAATLGVTILDEAAFLALLERGPQARKAADAETEPEPRAPGKQGDLFQE